MALTNLQALESLTEYRNSDLFNKVLTDRCIVSSSIYSSSNAQNIDLCLADIYLYLANHPEISEGNLSIKYTPTTLLALRRQIYDKWGLSVPEGSHIIKGANSEGRAYW